MLETRWENVVKLGQPRRTLGQRVLLQGYMPVRLDTRPGQRSRTVHGIVQVFR